MAKKPATKVKTLNHIIKLSILSPSDELSSIYYIKMNEYTQDRLLCE